MSSEQLWHIVPFDGRANFVGSTCLEMHEIIKTTTQITIRKDAESFVNQTTTITIKLTRTTWGTCHKRLEAARKNVRYSERKKKHE